VATLRNGGKHELLASLSIRFVPSCINYIFIVNTPILYLSCNKIYKEQGVEHCVIVCQWLATGRWFSPGPPPIQLIVESGVKHKPLAFQSFDFEPTKFNIYVFNTICEVEMKYLHLYYCCIIPSLYLRNCILGINYSILVSMGLLIPNEIATR
jgi:hypothetical protein